MNRCVRWSTALAAVLMALALSVTSRAQSNDDCYGCHDDPDLTTEIDGREISLAVDNAIYSRSVHGDLDCIDCHTELDGFDDFPHDELTEPVACETCHDDLAEVYAQSLHGRLAAEGAPLAPQCWDCHGKHDIRPPTSPGSRVAKFNIPFMCGECHKEGTPVTQRYDIPQDSIVTHYSQSIHGYGLFQQGLTVTAVCTDCHTAHSVLPHTDPRSSIFEDNVPLTCQKCHGLIEDVHQKVIRGELWEKEPDKVPVCVDCHSPHEARMGFYELGVADRDCLRCHADPELKTTRDGVTVSLYVDSVEVHNSKHRNIACAQCHSGVLTSSARACETITEDVDCSICHAEVVATYATSMHGELSDRGDPNAPECIDCHGVHNIRDHRDTKSPTHVRAVPDLCGKCHRAGVHGAVRIEHPEVEPFDNYAMSIHGQGLFESGLLVTAMCTDCHTAHHVLPTTDTASSVSPRNIAHTCAECHAGVYERFAESIHSSAVSDSKEKLPVCNDCHHSHTITRTDSDLFQFGVMEHCGDCHQDVTETYFQTFHGKVSKLGYGRAAKCSDCHGAHDILPPTDPESHLSRDRIVETCGQCHEGSHRRFAGYLTHATHHDRDKYPYLYYTFWFMTLLLVGTFVVAGLHTALWMPRAFQAMKRHKEQRKRRPEHALHVQRFTRYQRILHVMVIVSFLGLAVTGMTFKFSYLGWAQWISGMLGGFESAGFIHRICAVITFGYFGAHIVDVIRRQRRSRKSMWKYLFGPDSMIPNRNDGREFVATMKWFLGMGPRPEYGRWTYWEKFDYFAVFWGVAVIGTTGLMLWFPEHFTRLLPGWIINVATIIHSDEALLATGFILTIHFFNTHFRPDKFPMDTVIFTGRVPLEEFAEDRPREYRELVRSRQIKHHLVEPCPTVVLRAMKVLGWFALTTGLILVVLIIWAEIFGYR